MTLREFRKFSGVSYAHLARQCGVASCYIRNIATGHAYPSQKLAALIEYHTDGAVPASKYPPRIVKSKRNSRSKCAF